MELFLRSRYRENLQDLNGELCKQWLEAMFYYQETGTILENIDLGVKSILRQQIQERENDKKNYDDACEKQRLKALKRWHPEEYKSIQQNATVCHGIPQNANSNSNNNIILSKDNIIKKENKIKEKNKHLDFVLLSDDEYSKLIEKYGKGVIERKIEDLNNYIGSKGKKYKSHYFTILEWLRKENIKPLEKKTEIQRNDLPSEGLLGTITLKR